MVDLSDLIYSIKKEGYSDENAEAKVCQDVILKAIEQSSLKQNITIKGGVVMSNISHNVRRATQDIDIDFMRYSLSDESIRKFVSNINCLEGLIISIYGAIEELRQQDYHGKRVHVYIQDGNGYSIRSKIDFGVHKDLSVKQQEYCFDVCLDDNGACLLMNSREQMFVEKLRALLKFGVFSTRYKDVFDMYYLGKEINKSLLIEYFEKYIFTDKDMKEQNIEDVLRRVESIFKNQTYRRRLKTSKRNWIGESYDVVLHDILYLLKDLRNHIKPTVETSL